MMKLTRKCATTLALTILLLSGCGGGGGETNIAANTNTTPEVTPPAPSDADGDGITDANNPCPQDAANNSCDDPPVETPPEYEPPPGSSPPPESPPEPPPPESPPPADSDGDGMPDDTDPCPNDPTNECAERPPTGHLLADAKLNSWLEIPATELRDVLTPGAFESPIRYAGTPETIVGAWNGASWDAVRQELHIIAAGGHADYCGNQHLKFDLDDLRWTLVHPYSDFTVDPHNPHDAYEAMRIAGTTPDGRPISRHTYNGTIYAPSIDRHILFPGSSCSPSGDSDRKIWAIAPNGSHELLIDVDHPPGHPGWRGSRVQAVWDPVTEKIWINNQGSFFSFDPLTRQIQGFRAPASISGFKLGVALDPARRIMLLTGGGYFWIYNLSSDTLETYSDKGADFRDCYGPGLTYVASRDRYIAWCGGNRVYWIDPATFEYIAQTTAGTPASKTTYGMYGRFRYSEKYGGLVVVDSAYRNVKFLKLAASTP